MQYIDPRLSRILSDIRIEEARSMNNRKRNQAQRVRPVRRRLGLWMIEQGESLADGEPKAA